VYDEIMRIVPWLADHLTPTMLKRWMAIWFTLTLIGVLSSFP
jgi:hypothetical protein